MNWQIFFSTFVLIFLAELGDKTQLAAMARVASEGSARWTIFMAASLALMLSTLVAVLLGDALTRVVPERMIRLGAAVLFIVFGLLLAHQALAPRPDEVPAVHAPPGVITRFLFKQAAAFERAAMQDYGRMARQAEDPRLRGLLETLAREEQAHLDKIHALTGSHAGGIAAPEVLQRLPEREALISDIVSEDRPILEHAMEHEAATVNFYRELAHLTLIPALRTAFLELAAAEQQHLDRLKQLQGSGGDRG